MASKVDFGYSTSIKNNLLINNRKLRRKLEVMLEQGNFASVDYIDDITKELVDGEEVNESIELDEILESMSVIEKDLVSSISGEEMDIFKTLKLEEKDIEIRNSGFVAMTQF